tara:strand:+ start:54482 stop:55396 length:915 start_codon:yes stop_codon:yes gene_type:complete
MLNKFIHTVILLLLFSCSEKSDSDRILSNNTGKQSEIILVVEDNYWNGIVGEELRTTFEKEIQGLPQSEQFFNLIQINSSEFNRFFQTHKNIIFVSEDLHDSYTRNKWSRGQIVIYLDCSDFDQFTESCEKAFNYIDKKELENIKFNYKQGHNKKATKWIKDNFSIDLFVPTEYTISLKEKDILIADFHSYNEHQDLLKYIIVYEFYKNDTDLSNQIIYNTDSVMQKYILGSEKSSYVTTDKRIPIIKVNNTYKGLWTLKNGFMAGPFIIKYREIEDKIVVTIGLIFYPNELKRDYVRTLEAIL